MYNANIRDSGLEGSAVVGDLVAEEARPPLSDAGFRDFDIAAVGLGFHHFEHPELCLRRLVERVRVGGGVCLILDWLPHGHGEGHGHAEGHGHSHGHGHGHGHDHGNGDKSDASGEKKKDEWEAMQSTIKHHGFSEETMKKMFEDAGLVDFRFEVLEEPFVLQPKGRTIVKRGFLARGRRA